MGGEVSVLHLNWQNGKTSRVWVHVVLSSTNNTPPLDLLCLLAPPRLLQWTQSLLRCTSALARVINKSRLTRVEFFSASCVVCLFLLKIIHLSLLFKQDIAIIFSTDLFKQNRAWKFMFCFARKPPPCRWAESPKCWNYRLDGPRRNLTPSSTSHWEDNWFRKETRMFSASWTPQVNLTVLIPHVRIPAVGSKACYHFNYELLDQLH